MKTRHYLLASIFLISCFVLFAHQGLADDTCTFQVTADDLPPNIVILLDTGAEMRQVAWHSNYDPDVDYTPRDGVDNDVDGDTDEADEIDGVENAPGVPDAEIAWRVEVASSSADDRGTGNGFFHENGYAICAGDSLVPISDLLAAGSCNNANDVKLEAISTDTDNNDTDFATFTITNSVTSTSKTIKLAAVANTKVFPAGSRPAGDTGVVIDKATNLRYSANYLNWLFFSGNYAGDGWDDGADDSDLPKVSRFYHAKKAIMDVVLDTADEAKFGIYNFENDEGGSRARVLALQVDTQGDQDPANDTLDNDFVNKVNSMATTLYSPLAEGLQTVGGYYAGNDAGIEDEIDAYCQKLFALVITPGVSSHDTTGSGNQYVPQNTHFSDLDGDGTDRTYTLLGHPHDDVIDTVTAEGTLTVDATTYTIPTNIDGTTWLDDIAYYYYKNDVVPENVAPGRQNVSTYTLGLMASAASTVFLKNVSNLGNGVTNVTDSSDPDYGRYHFEADSPGDVATQLLAAVNQIISQTSTFTAPVVPVTRTTSGDRIYMAFFKPSDSSIFWQGQVTKFGISSTNQIVDFQGGAATHANGALLETAVPYWDTINWSAESAPDTPCDNRMDNRTGQANSRNIYTYLGGSTDLTHDSNAFVSTNPALTAAVLGNPTHSTSYIINYVRGADVDDEDSDTNTTENRALITGDVLHSEPLVVYYNSSTTVVYYGANDGMLHAVDDSTGKELWGFIPVDQLGRLKDMVEGASHQYYIDSSPKVYFKDVDGDREVESADGDQVILMCGERKGGVAYFALDVTDPTSPEFAWWISQANYVDMCAMELDSVSGTFVDNDLLSGAPSGGSASVYGTLIGGSLLFYDNITTNFAEGDTVSPGAGATGDGSGDITTIYCPEPDTIVSELGYTWSEPSVGVVKTAAEPTGLGVFFVGGGYSSDNSKGKTVLAINALTGAVVKQFIDIDSDGDSNSDMLYSIPGSVYVVDGDANGFVDKIYVGDLGSQMWRIGKFTNAAGDPLTFPSTDEYIDNWVDANAKVLFEADSTNARDFFYPPSLTRMTGYDLIYMGTGDREDACSTTTSDKIYCVRDTHGSTTLAETDLVDVTVEADPAPNLDDPTEDVDTDGSDDQGWRITLAAGEKVLAENTVYYKTLYITTFTPNDDSCLPGGVGTLYGLNYLTGAAAVDYDSDGDTEREVSLGGGIPSKPVTVITSSGEKLYISVGSTLSDGDENTDETFEAGIVAIAPLSPPINFFKLWWKEFIP